MLPSLKCIHLFLLDLIFSKLNVFLGSMKQKPFSTLFYSIVSCCTAEDAGELTSDSVHYPNTSNPLLDTAQYLLFIVG